MLPIARDGDELVVAFADPGDVLALDDAQTATGLAVQRVIAERLQLKRAINRVWHRSTVRTSVEEAENDATLGTSRLHDPVSRRPQRPTGRSYGWSRRSSRKR